MKCMRIMRDEARILSESPGFLHHLSSEGSPACDGLNRLLTLGQDQRWRRQAARACLANRPARVLDLGCGTGELSFQLLRLDTTGAELVAVDFSASRLEVARKKAQAAGVAGRISFVQADAAQLPFAAASFASLGIAFAFRTLTYRNPLREDFLAEMHRVLAPAGRLVIVETSQPRARWWRSCVHGYLRAIVGPLSRSARRFYQPEEVARILHRAGFDEVKWTPLLGGVASLHIAIR